MHYCSLIFILTQEELYYSTTNHKIGLTIGYANFPQISSNRINSDTEVFIHMFNAKGILLQQEGHLFHSCLTVGLTALMTANLDRKGDFYSAFFQLSIGLERAMKVVIIIEHMATNQLKAPTKSQIQSYGHDLIQLSYCISRIFEIVSSLYELLRCVTRYAQAVDSESEKELSSIPFMEEFLEFARYPDPELWPILK